MTPKRRIIPVFVPHRGCPYRCVFCNQRRISGRIVPQTAESAAREIRQGLEKTPAGVPVEVAFYGGSFTAIPAEEQEGLLGAALPFLHSGAVSALRVSTRPDRVDREALARLRRFGVETVELGVQSLQNPVLAQCGRGHTAEDAFLAVAALKEAGFSVILQMMTGLPGDSAEGDIDTAEKIVGLQPDGVRIYPTVVLPDTPLYDLWQAGLYKAHTVEEAVPLCAALLDRFEAANIPVIRLGLNPTDALTQGGAVAGAYHPAFGQLVYSYRYLEKMRRLLREHPPGKTVCLGVAPGQTSLAVGQKRCNLLALCQEFSLTQVKILEKDLKKGEIALLRR